MEIAYSTRIGPVSRNRPTASPAPYPSRVILRRGCGRRCQTPPHIANAFNTIRAHEAFTLDDGFGRADPPISSGRAREASVADGGGAGVLPASHEYA